MTIPPLIHLIFIFLVPLYLYLSKKESLLISWIVLSLFTDIFNSCAYLNITAMKATSLILLPYFLKNIKHLYKTMAGKLILIYFLYLGVMSLIHGHIFPWPDTSGTRTLRDLSQGRTTLHLGSMVLEFIIIFYLANKFKFERYRQAMMKALLFSGIFVISGILLEHIFQFDFYHFFTSDNHGLAYGFIRTHGFSYEPRGASQALAYSIFVFLIYGNIKVYQKWILCTFAVMAMYMTTSSTGILMLFAGLALLLLIHLTIAKQQIRPFLQAIAPFVLALIIGSIVVLFNSQHPKVIEWKENISERDYLVTATNIPEHFEVFDGTAINFFMHHPRHLIFGTGPGLVSIAASPYIIERDKATWTNRIDPLPHMGAVLLIANSGIVGLIPLLLALFLLGKTFFIKYKKNPDKLYHPLLITILILSLYLIQLRYFHPIGLALLISFSLPRRENETS